MPLSTSAKTALAIAGAVALYFGVRLAMGSKTETAAPASEPPPFAVLAETIKPQDFRDEVLIRGRTQALRKVEARAETAGIVKSTPVEPGAEVGAGAALCTLRIDARQAGLAEARAALAKATLDHEAAVKLSQEGFRSETAVATSKAALDLARANLEQAELAVAKTTIRAPWAGTFDQRLVEVGDLMNVGDACGVLIQKTPFLVVGAVSERDVAKISQGDKGAAILSTGERVDGVVRFVSKAADPATRTFEVQLEVPNESGAIRDGVTADFNIAADRRAAHFVPRSALTFSDDGQIGLRLVRPDDTVAFVAVRLVGEAEDGVFVSGLEGEVRVITRGQEFVAEGQKVAVATARS